MTNSQTSQQRVTSQNGEVAFWTINSNNLHLVEPSFSTVHSYILVLKGELTFKTNDKEFKITQNKLADIMGICSTQLLSSSPDVIGCQVSIENNFFKNIIKQKPPFPLAYIIRCRLNPVVDLSAEQVKVMMKYSSRLNEALLDKGNLYHTEIVEKELSIFIYELANIVCQMGSYIKEETEFNKKKKIMMQFLELLTQNVMTERSVSFYASRLCISNQYLARIVKEETNSTVYDCISYFLLNEAEILLMRKESTVQQISETLNFSDQASFSKFFKKHKGVSPLKFMMGENR